MILAIDMGNTNIEIGCVDDEKILFTERVSTDRRKTELEYAVLIKTILELHGVEAKRIVGRAAAHADPLHCGREGCRDEAYDGRSRP